MAIRLTAYCGGELFLWLLTREKCRHRSPVWKRLAGLAALGSMFRLFFSFSSFFVDVLLAQFNLHNLQFSYLVEVFSRSFCVRIVRRGDASALRMRLTADPRRDVRHSRAVVLLFRLSQSPSMPWLGVTVRRILIDCYFTVSIHSCFGSHA